MPDLSADDPTLNRSDMAEQEKHVRYSGAIHKLFVILNGGCIGFLQVKYQSSKTSPFESHHTTILSFFVFTLVYFVLRVSEIKLRVPKLREFVGNISHFFGAIAILLLLSVISLAFALFLLPFVLAWFSAIAYISFKELNFSPENPINPRPPNQPPV